MKRYLRDCLCVLPPSPKSPTSPGSGCGTGAAPDGGYRIDLGFPLSADEKKALERAMVDPDHGQGADAASGGLDQRCLYGVHINPEMRVKVAPGPAKAELVQNGWTQFLGEGAQPGRGDMLRSKRQSNRGHVITRQPIKSRIVGCRSKPTTPSL